MQTLRGTVLQCGRFGCVVRLEDGRFALLPDNDRKLDAVRRTVGLGLHPRLDFAIEGDERGRPRLTLATAGETAAEPAARLASLLEEKIINYLRQTADWDPDGAAAQRALKAEAPRSDRLLPFEMRARRQLRDAPEKPRRPKR